MYSTASEPSDPACQSLGSKTYRAKTLMSVPAREEECTYLLHHRRENQPGIHLRSLRHIRHGLSHYADPAIWIADPPHDRYIDVPHLVERQPLAHRRHVGHASAIAEVIGRCTLYSTAV